MSATSTTFKPYEQLQQEISSEYGEEYKHAITKIPFGNSKIPLWIKHTPARLATNILAHNRKTKYTQIGVIGLPGCYDEQTEILTIDGWKNYKQISMEDSFATINPETHELEYQKPTDIVKKPYNGPMIKIKSNQVDLFVTPNHRMWVAKRNIGDKGKKRFRIFAAADIYGKDRIYFKKNAKWSGGYNKDQHYFYIPAIVIDRKVYRYSKPAIQIPLEEWVKFYGLWLAEGYTTYYELKGLYVVGLRMKNRQLIEEMADLLKKWGFQPNVTNDDNGMFGVNVDNKQLYTYLARFGKSIDKFVDKDIKNVDPKYLKILLDYYLKGDGLHEADDSHLRCVTISEKLRDDIQEIALKIGWSANYSVGFVADALHSQLVRCDGQELRMLRPTKNTTWVVTIIRAQNEPVVSKRHFDPYSIEQYGGTVWCPSVPNGIVYVRRNGIPCWCGNTGKTTATFNLIHALHTMAPEYQIHHYVKDKILELDSILESLPKKRDCILFFDDISFLLENLKKERVNEILHKLTIVREVLDPDHKKTRCIIFLDFHYSYALLKAFRQTNFRVITSITDEERENYNKVFGYHNRDNIKEFARKYLSMMRYDKFEIPSPNEQPFVYHTDAPFRIALVSNLGELHYMMFHEVNCGICRPGKKFDKPDKKFWLDLADTYGFNLTYRVLGEYIFTHTGKLTIPQKRKKVWNHITDHHREFHLDLDALYKIFKDTRALPKDQRREFFAAKMAELELQYADGIEKASKEEIENVPPDGEGLKGSEKDITIPDEEEDEDDDEEDDLDNFDDEDGGENGSFTLGGYDFTGGGNGGSDFGNDSDDGMGGMNF